MYGDVFGVLPKTTDADVRIYILFFTLFLNHIEQQGGEPVDRTPWGELEPEEGMVTCIICVRKGHVDDPLQRRNPSPRKKSPRKRRRPSQHHRMACRRLPAWRRHRV